MKKAQVTIKDIAKELGVSFSTVSKALKDSPNISEKTKVQVREMAQKLNYRPNGIALSLKNSSSKTIGVIIPEIVHFFFSSVISGIEDVAHKSNYSVTICQSNELYNREVTNAHALLNNRVDGVLVSITKQTHTFGHLRLFTDNNIPLVFFDRSTETVRADKVIVDDFDAAYMATKHLIDQGCKKIAHLSGPEDLEIAQLRQEGYKKALEDYHLLLKDTMSIYGDNLESGYVAMNQLLDGDIYPDAVFTVNEQCALGAYKSIKEHGLSIPDDVAVIGFSGGWFANVTEPNLSTIDQHGYEMGKKATEKLIDRIENGIPALGELDTLVIQSTLEPSASTNKKKL